MRAEVRSLLTETTPCFLEQDQRKLNSSDHIQLSDGFELTSQATKGGNDDGNANYQSIPD